MKTKFSCGCRCTAFRSRRSSRSSAAPRCSTRSATSAPGATIEQAQAELGTVAGRLAQTYPKTNGIRAGVRVRPLQEQLVHDYRLALLVLLAAVGAVLLIACANVANLLLARGTGRQKEMAIRAALGASRGRLARQLLTESLLLSVIGGGIGLLIALWGVAALVAASPIAIPRLHDVHVDRTVLLFAIVASTITGIVFGLAPALHASRANAGETLKDAGRGTSGGRTARTRQLLVVVEVALSLVLLASAGLLGRTLVALQHVDPGFVAEHAIGMQLSLQDKRYPKAPEQIAFYHRLIDETRAIPGVVSSAVSTTLPLSGSDIGMGFTIEGRPETADPATRKSAVFFGVSPEYFTAMGIHLVRGRFFTERDDEKAPDVIVIGETFAKRYWPNENPIGRRITVGYNKTGPREIVGVVADVKQSDLAERPALEMYTPFPQTPWPFIAVVVRAQGDPTAMAASVRRTLAHIDPEQPAAEIKTLNDYVAQGGRHAAVHGDALRRVRRARARARRLRSVQRDGVLRCAASARNRHPDGARRAGVRRAIARALAGALARHHRACDRHRRRARRNARARRASLRRHRERSGHLRRGVGGAAVRHARGGVSPRTPRHACGPHDCVKS